MAKSAMRSETVPAPGRNEARTRNAVSPSLRSRLAGWIWPSTGGATARIAPAANIAAMPWEGITPGFVSMESGMVVGLARFELTTFRPPDERATKLRYSPTPALYSDAPGRGKGKAASPGRIGEHVGAERHEPGDEVAELGPVGRTELRRVGP